MKKVILGDLSSLNDTLALAKKVILKCNCITEDWIDDVEDVIIEPVRSILIPGFEETKRRSLEAGALGGGISGSGPSIFMLSTEETTAKNVEAIMQEVFHRLGIEYKTYVTSISKQGVEVINGQ